VFVVNVVVVVVIVVDVVVNLSISFSSSSQLKEFFCCCCCCCCLFLPLLLFSLHDHLTTHVDNLVRVWYFLLLLARDEVGDAAHQVAADALQGLGVEDGRLLLHVVLDGETLLHQTLGET